jgi:hypothetical protein
MNAFNSLVPQTRQPRNLDLLDQGQHLVLIGEIAYETDRGDGTTEKDWVDENDVLYIYLVCDAGVFHLRFYLNGYWKYEDLLREPKFRNELQHYRKTNCDASRGYAIDIRTNKRVFSEKNSKYAMNLFEEFATAAGNGVAIGPDDMKDRQLWIELVPEFVNGKKKMKLLRVACEKDGFKSPARTNQSGLIMPATLESEAAIVPNENSIVPNF